MRTITDLTFRVVGRTAEQRGSATGRRGHLADGRPGCARCLDLDRGRAVGERVRVRAPEKRDRSFGVGLRDGNTRGN